MTNNNNNNNNNSINRELGIIRNRLFDISRNDLHRIRPIIIKTDSARGSSIIAGRARHQSGAEPTPSSLHELNAAAPNEQHAVEHPAAVETSPPELQYRYRCHYIDLVLFSNESSSR